MEVDVFPLKISEQLNCRQIVFRLYQECVEVYRLEFEPSQLYNVGLNLKIKYVPVQFKPLLEINRKLKFILDFLVFRWFANMSSLISEIEV